MNIQSYLEQNPNVSRKKLSIIFGISDWQARKAKEKFNKEKLDEFEQSELVDHAVNLELKNQKLRDTQRVERKIRKDYRNTNHVKDLINKLIDCVNERDTVTTYKHVPIDLKSSIGIFQFSDAHFNEIIDTPNNKFDFEIASKRCEKFVKESILYFDVNNVDTVIFCMTGDMINSDRRPDEKVSMVTSRAKAAYLASLIIEQMILHLNQFFNVKVAFVVGNESRSFEIGRADIIMSDNYDLTIVSMLKLMFRDTEIEFLESNLVDCILTIHNKNILLIHGEKLPVKNMQKTIQELKGKYTQQGIIIDYVIFGHVHECYISDQFARCASLSGGNGYSEYDLNFSSRASQNIHIVNSDCINSIKIDLQNYDEYNGYKLDEMIKTDIENDINKNKKTINVIKM